MACSEKGALKEGRTIVFCDQWGFYLLPTVVRTYAPMGETPISQEKRNIVSQGSEFGQYRL